MTCPVCGKTVRDALYFSNDTDTDIPYYRYSDIVGCDRCIKPLYELSEIEQMLEKQYDEWLS